jgi:rhodanese-related sulfurtransferase
MHSVDGAQGRITTTAHTRIRFNPDTTPGLRGSPPVGLLLAVALVVASVLVAVAAPAGAGHPRTPPLLTIDAASLQHLTATGRPVLTVDVRTLEAYANGRLPGARSIPLPSLVARQRELPADRIVVLYGGDGLEDATTAYRYLRAAGHSNVFVLEGGFVAWQSHGYGVER